MKWICVKEVLVALSKKDAFALTICERRASREQAKEVRSGKKSHSKKERGHEDKRKASGLATVYLIA